MKDLKRIKFMIYAFFFLAVCLMTCKKNDNSGRTQAYGAGTTTTGTSTTGGTSTGTSTTGGTTGGYGDSTDFPVTQVYVFNYHFSPPDISISQHSSVSWTNRDSIAHTVTSRDGAFDSGDLGAGKNFFVTFPNTGYHSYYCRYHKEGGNITVH